MGRRPKRDPIADLPASSPDAIFCLLGRVQDVAALSRFLPSFADLLEYLDRVQLTNRAVSERATYDLHRRQR